MLLVKYTTLFFLFLSSHSQGSWQPVSAVRSAEETYLQASQRIHSSHYSGLQLSKGPTAEDVRTTLDRLDVSALPEFQTDIDMAVAYDYIRDTRFIEDASLKFPRRLSWLYPDDGCFIRAELASQFLRGVGFISPKKIYAFGKLEARTPYSASGAVTWWYHVAIAYRLGPLVYVFDPSVDFHKPMPLKQWHGAIGGEKGLIEYAICDAESFDPLSPCQIQKGISRSHALSVQMHYLKYEWKRLQELNKDPDKELGDNPPWK